MVNIFENGAASRSGGSFMEEDHFPKDQEFFRRADSASLIELQLVFLAYAVFFRRMKHVRLCICAIDAFCATFLIGEWRMEMVSSLCIGITDEKSLLH